VLPQLFAPADVLPIFATTFAINLPIVLITCPLLMKAISPKIGNWGFPVSNFFGWWQRKNQGN
jgi:hypothetical protein